MKQLSLLFTLVIIALSAFTQQKHYMEYDFLMRRTVIKHIQYSYFADQNLDGFCAIKIDKNGSSIKVKTLYSSDKRFDLKKDKAFLQTLNSMKDSFPEKYSLIIPFYFDFYEEDDWSDSADVALIKMELRYKNRNRILATLIIKKSELDY